MNRDKKRQYEREYYWKNKDKLDKKSIDRYHNGDKKKHYKINRNAVLKRKYNIDLEVYNLMKEEQDGKCFLCNGTNKDGKDLAVDHNHDTGEVRKLLCFSCNAALGLFNDDPNLLLKAASYILSHGGYNKADRP